MPAETAFQIAVGVVGSLIGALCEGLIGPLATEAAETGAMREAVQTLTLFALRAVGVVDAHARGLVVQTALPAREQPRWEFF